MKSRGEGGFSLYVIRELNLFKCYRDEKLIVLPVLQPAGSCHRTGSTRLEVDWKQENLSPLF